MIYKAQRFYDVVIQSINAATGVATVQMANGQIYDYEEASPYWSCGQRGVLEVTSSAVQFWAYTEPTLRRQPRLDRDHPQLGEVWAWSVGGAQEPILTKPHFVPGLRGRYIADLSEPIELSIPPEMVDLCQSRGLTVEQVLRGLMADLCGLQSSPVLPREDGFASQGVVEQVKAMQWLNQAFPNEFREEDLTEGGV